MRAAGMDAEGEIGDGDPLQAIEDAHADVRTRRARHLDAPRGPLHWLERGVVTWAVRELLRFP